MEVNNISDIFKDDNFYWMPVNNGYVFEPKIVLLESKTNLYVCRQTWGHYCQINTSKLYIKLRDCLKTCVEKNKQVLKYYERISEEHKEIIKNIKDKIQEDELLFVDNNNIYRL